MVSPVIRLDAADNVVVARTEIKAGTEISTENIRALADVPQGHKLATRPIRQNEPILKYNTVIGYASCDLLPGDYLHSHNIRFDDVEKDYAFSRDYAPTAVLPEEQRESFMGYRRENGRVGTRNMIGFFITVNCSATVAKKVSAYFDEERLADYSNVDGVVAFVHEQGCGMEMSGEPMDLLRRTLSGYIRHPNIGGALVLSLGCERNNLMRFFQQEGLSEGKTLKTITMQEVGGTQASVHLGIQAVKELLNEVNQHQRTPCSAEHLLIGLQCGGSDGFSGLSANPGLGKAMDILVRHGGGAILS
ncbi:MAG: UxaA family hydrolase [Burkholderiaceae bacterium]